MDEQIDSYTYARQTTWGRFDTERFHIVHDHDGIRIIGTAEQMEEWKKDPVAFIEQLIGQPLEDWQKEVLRRQQHMIEMQEYGFSIRGTAPADDPNNVTIESVHMVQTVPHQRGKRLTSAGLATLVLGTGLPRLPAPEEFAKSMEWTYAAPEPERRGRQAFKDVANKSSWSRHDGRRKRRR